MFKLPTAGLRRPSFRASLALGGAAAVMFGVFGASETLAGSTDDATAHVPQIASQNFFPTPLTPSVSCSTSGGANLVKRRANFSWPAVAGATGYRAELINRSNGAVKESRDIAGTSWNDVSDGGHTGLYLRVRTINTGSVSTGYTVSSVGASWKDYVSGRTECEGGTGTNLANQTWENTADEWTPAAPQREGKAFALKAAPKAENEGPESSEKPVPSTSETEKPSTSETSEPSAPSETPSEPSSTEQVAPETSEPTTEGPVTIGVRLAGGSKYLGLFVNGEAEPRCDVKVGAEDTWSINGDTVAISNGGSVTRVKPVVDPSTGSCTQS
ncbi:hypothetical protein [Gordonia alkaliphila]|uniref:Uncharacterized protein n=1 Tax=Gordonia alkaliphila TaxID=1053547 RepID=A0ABP8Z2Q9_9ACTN